MTELSHGHKKKLYTVQNQFREINSRLKRVGKKVEIAGKN